MQKIFTILILPLLFCSCSDREKLITFPPGEYISDCFVEGSDSKKTSLTIERGFKSQTVQNLVFTGVTNCSGTSTPEAEPVTNEVSIIFSNVNLGNRFSYLTTTFDDNGEEKTEFIAFKFENSRLYFSPAVTSLGADPKITFADFVAEPEFIADLILTRKNLNQPLSKN